MTELTFLIELLLHHELQLVTKEFIAARLKDVEATLLAPRPSAQAPEPAKSYVDARGVPQAPSTLAAMQRHAHLEPIEPTMVVPAAPVAIVAQTPATMAALASRQQAISESLAGKVDKQSGRPRKF